MDNYCIGDGVKMKTCTMCEEVKNLEEFYKNDRACGGYSSACYSCMNEAKQKARAEKAKKKKRTPVAETKTCSTCNEEKNAEEFNRDAASVDGLGYICRECLHAKPKKDHAVTLAEKQCSMCKEVKDASCFFRAKHIVGGLRSSCKECMSAKDKERRERSK